MRSEKDVRAVSMTKRHMRGALVADTTTCARLPSSRHVFSPLIFPTAIQTLTGFSWTRVDVVNEVSGNLRKMWARFCNNRARGQQPSTKYEPRVFMSLVAREVSASVLVGIRRGRGRSWQGPRVPPCHRGSLYWCSCMSVRDVWGHLCHCRPLAMP